MEKKINVWAVQGEDSIMRTLEREANAYWFKTRKESIGEFPMIRPRKFRITLKVERV